MEKKPIKDIYTRGKETHKRDLYKRSVQISCIGLDLLQAHNLPQCGIETY